MPLWPKKHFIWSEPKPFLTKQDAADRAKLKWWHRPAFFLGIGAILMAHWYAARFIPGKHPPPFYVALCLALALGVFCTYLIPWINSISSSKVSLLDTCLVRLRGNAHRQIKYSEMESFAWRTDDGISVLAITEHKHGREIVFGVPPDVPFGEISQFLIDRHVSPRVSLEIAK